MKRFFPAFLFVLVATAEALLGSAFASAQTIPVLSCVVISSDLSIGSQTASVTELQNFLYAQGFLTVTPTGYYGTLTSAAVSKFQTSVGLPAVGVVGPLTRAAIQKATCITPTTPPAAAATSTAPASPTAASSTSSTIATSTAIGQEPESVGPPPISADATTTAATSTAAMLPYNAQSFFDWQPVWGDVTFATTTGTLGLVGSLSNNGAEAVYPASEGWTDYRYTANVSVANGNVGLIGRYVDSNDYLECNFSPNWVELDQTTGGNSTVLVSKTVNGILSGIGAGLQTTSVAMDVQGNTVGCAGFGPGDNITYTLPAGSPMAGGIGIESWYSTPLADQLNLNSVQVTAL